MSDVASRTRALRAFVVITTIVLLTRLPALFIARDGLLFNVDELELVRSIVDRFIGVPSTSLAWPGSLLQMVGVAGVALGAVFVPVTSPDALATYLSGLYLDGSGLLDFLRFVTACVMAGGFAFYYLCMRERGRDRLFSVGTTLIFATTPIAALYATYAVGDGLAFTLVLLCGLWLESRPGPRREWIAGGLFGLALAAKFTAVLALPWIVVSLIARASDAKSARTRLFAFATAGLFALLLACPYLWLDPLRVAKSVLGNVGRDGDALGLVSSLWELVSALSAPMAVLGVTGIGHLVSARRFSLAFGALTSLALLVLVTANAGVVYDRYYLPGLAVVGLVGLHAPWPRNAGRLDTIFLSVCIVIFGLANGLGYVMAIDERIDDGRDRQAALRNLTELPEGAKVYLPLRDLLEAPGLMSSASLLRVADSIDRAMLEGASREALVKKTGFTPAAARILSPAFNEDERSWAARLRAMAGTTTRTGLDATPWLPDGARFGILTDEEVRAAYRASPSHYLMTKRDGACTEYLYLGREGRSAGSACFYFPGDAPQGVATSPGPDS